MAKLKLNNAENYERIGKIKLTKEKFPIAFENKVQELIEDGGYSRKDAKELVENMDFELEIYYHKGYGLFAVESDAVEDLADIYSPYTAEKYESWL